MEADHSSRPCGKCGAENPEKAAVCVSCGAVLAAYAPPGGEPPTGPAPEPDAAPAIQQEIPKRPAPTASGQDWRALFERPLETDRATSRSGEPENSTPINAAEWHEILTHTARPSPARTASPPPPQAPIPPPANQPAGPPGGSAPDAVAPPPASPSPSSRPAATARPQPPARPRRPQVAAVAVVDPRAANRAIRSQMKSPLWIMYAGIGLLLGGCVLSLLLAMVIENSSVIGFAFICTVPVGLVLFVVGYIRLMMRKEGRRPR